MYLAHHSETCAIMNASQSFNDPWDCLGFGNQKSKALAEPRFSSPFTHTLDQLLEEVLTPPLSLSPAAQQLSKPASWVPLDSHVAQRLLALAFRQEQPTAFTAPSVNPRRFQEPSKQSTPSNDSAPPTVAPTYTLGGGAQQQARCGGKKRRARRHREVPASCLSLLPQPPVYGDQLAAVHAACVEFWPDELVRTTHQSLHLVGPINICFFPIRYPICN